MINAILACDYKYGIGKKGNIPWPKHKKDLSYFKKRTLNQTVVMGRKTCESLPFKLPNRKSIVLTRSPSFASDKADSVFTCKDKLKEKYKSFWVIGGSEIFNAFISDIYCLHLTIMLEAYNCDRFINKNLINTFMQHNASIRLDEKATVQVYGKRIFT